MINSPGLSALNLNNNFENDIPHLEFHFEAGNIETFELIEYDTKKYILTSKKDYNQARIVLKKWISENQEKTDQQYQYWVDSKVYNNYEGFYDTLSQLKICDNERESAFDDLTRIIDQTAFLQKDLNSDCQNQNFSFEMNIDKDKPHEKEYSAHKNNDKILDDEAIGGIANDAFKKKNKKRRTRKDRRKKEQEAAENLEAYKNELPLKEQNQVEYWTSKEKKFEKEILRFLKRGRIFKHKDKVYSILMIFDCIYFGEIQEEIGSRGREIPGGIGKYCFKDGREFFGDLCLSVSDYVIENNNFSLDSVIENNKFSLDSNQKGTDAYFGADHGGYILGDSGEYEGYVKGISGKGKHLNPEEGVYYGEIKFYKKHGQGEMVYNNGDRYIGEWEDDYPNGTGEKVKANGTSYYKGEWDYGHFHGKGEFVSNNGNLKDCKYIGEFKDDKLSGDGEIVYLKTGDRYVGEFEDNGINGFGTMVYSGNEYSDCEIGGRYVGEWKNWKKNGKGEFFYSNGQYFKGKWFDDLEHGEGEMIYLNGDHYDGDWECGKKSGKGEIIYANGDRYIGEWKDDKKSGIGEMVYQNGESFFAKWKDDKPYNSNQ